MAPTDVAGEERGSERTPHPWSAAAARDLVACCLQEHTRHSVGSGEPRAGMALTDALLVTSELVTNAIRHGDGVAEFSVRVTDGGLELSVSDHSDRMPAVRQRPDTQAFPVGGYGWPLVQRLATRIVVTPLAAGGKRISVLLPLA
ncbi:ATP-binding protein [Streptomyces sp. NPDC059176]|uniref:ATP-binding protein n=1 Tax=unclassified Streptomyces TaxID=2593676 RepID=UPI0036763701